MNQTITFSATTAVDTETRTFSGIAVPYGQITRDGRQTQFASGAFGDLDSQALTALMVQHPMSTGAKAIRVGRVTEWTDSAEALSFTARLNDSEEAEAIYQALKAGDISEVSVGVYVDEFTEDEDGLVTFSSASLLELSLITEGSSAFADSKILVVHSEQPSEDTAASNPSTKEIQNMEDTTNPEVAELRSDLEELARSVSVFADQRPAAAPAESKFKSFGQVVKAVAAGDEDAIREINEFAYNGPESADVNHKHVWAKPLLDIVNLGRPVASLFDKQPDPKTNHIDYLKIDTDTIQVAEQVNEGDDLAYGKIDLTSASASLKTYGGWFDFSQQSLDRSDANVVDLGYRALAARYAAVTEAVVRTTFLGATGTSVTGFNPATYSSVIDTVVDVQTMFNNRGKNIEFIVASPDVFKALAKANTGTANDFVLTRGNGSADVRGISAILFGIPVKVLPSGTGVFTFTNSSALTIWESGVGKLTDSNVVNLTSQFSLYGYMGVAVTDELSIVKAVA